jgi:molybdopterin synthase catalytic subunit
MTVMLLDRAFDPWNEVRRYQETNRAQVEGSTGGQAGKYGATACFVGTVRDFNEDRTVQGMTLEHYPEMTQRYLDHLSGEARQRWAITDLLIIHRYGELYPSDPIVLIAVWAAHRAPAFEACRYLIEELKSGAPFWKREVSLEGARWVERNTPG